MDGAVAEVLENWSRNRGNASLPSLGPSWGPGCQAGDQAIRSLEASTAELTISCGNRTFTVGGPETSGRLGSIGLSPGRRFETLGVRG